MIDLFSACFRRNMSLATDLRRLTVRLVPRRSKLRFMCPSELRVFRYPCSSVENTSMAAPSRFQRRIRRRSWASILLSTLLVLCVSDSSASITPLSSDTAPKSPASRNEPAHYPLVPFTLINAFEPPLEDWLPGHRGIDLEAQVGQDVYMPRSGTVHFAGVIAGRSVVSLRLPNGDLISFEPVATHHATGDWLQTGAIIGIVTDEQGHCSDQTCVHVGLRRSSQYLNPLLLFPDLRPPIVLLPPIE